MSSSLIKGENLNTDLHTERMPYDREDGDGGDASTSQGALNTASNDPKLGSGHETDRQKEPTLPTP